MSFSIHPVFIQDSPHIARVSMTSFMQDSHFALLFPNATLPTMITNSALRWPKNYLQGAAKNKHHQKAIDTATGEIISYARWVLPESLNGKWEAAQVRLPSQEVLDELDVEAAYASATEDGNLAGMNTKILSHTGHELERAEKALIGDQVHLYVDYLATIPTHQGRGAGSLLLQQGLALADAEGLRTFVMAMPTGLRLYEKFGFKKMSWVTHDDRKWGGEGDYTHYFLMREPGGGRE